MDVIEENIDGVSYCRDVGQSIILFIRITHRMTHFIIYS